MLRALVVVTALFFASSPLHAQVQERLVIQFNDRMLPEGLELAQRSPDDRIKDLVAHVQNVSGAPVRSVRTFGQRALIFEGTTEELSQVKGRLSSDPGVAWIAPDRRISSYAQSPLIGVINNLDLTLAPRSWHHRSPSNQPASMNTVDMWNFSHGSLPSVVAVLDTGVIMDHPALQGHLVQGYDFVSDAFIGNDGQSDGVGDRDNDPSDPGDGTTFADVTEGGCSVASNSSWHGTFVSGLISGNPANDNGVFPVAYNNTILPVRVLGRCGGFSTDLADAIRWAAGLPVAGAPSNPFPAKVINLSLGAQGACVSQIEGAAIAAARNAGSIIVAAAGNQGNSVDSPANCPGAIGVAATDQEGLKASYSNFGSSVDLTAPGGDSAFPIWSASNSGAGAPAVNTYRSKTGSSFSSALVSGALGVAFASNPGLSAGQLESALLSSTRSFLSLNGTPTCGATLVNTECNCTSAVCGSGMLDAGALLASVSIPSSVDLLSLEGNVVASGGSLTFSATSLDNGVPVFEIGSIVRATGDNSPALSVSGSNATVTLPEGVSSFQLKASIGNSSAVAGISAANNQVLFPSLIFGLTDSLSGGVSDSPIGATSPDGGTNGTTQGDTGANAGGGGGGHAGSLSGLLALIGLVLARRRCVFYATN